MLDAKKIKKLFLILNGKLERSGDTAEIGIVEGAVMCLVFESRKSTKDVGAIFQPAAIVRKYAEEIATDEKIPKDWLNDAAKAYLVKSFKRENLYTFSHLKIWTPEARYMLAMKCLSARWDSSDKDDVVFLIKHLKLKKASSVLSLLEEYYPKKQIPSKTQFFIEEIFDTGL